ncbi:MAG: hypothetical protein M5R38_19020 [Candidatus Methylomirabilis sp.]|nr:hypothetical protein [Candidatus Methylomirabilis sp.]
MVIPITHGGYIKRSNLNVYRSQRRGGKGMSGMATKEEDYVEHLFVATTHSHLLLFTNQGKVHWLKVHELPCSGTQQKGRPSPTSCSSAMGSRSRPSSRFASLRLIATC